MPTQQIQEPEPEAMECQNAEEYALRRLEEEDGKLLKSQDLADEYKCTKSHMQTVLRELAREGEIKRVGWGRYAAISDDSEEENDDQEEETGYDIPSVDGDVRSQATDTTETFLDDDCEGPVQCPADGCDYEAFSVDGFRKHSNAVRGHDWEDVEDELDYEVLDDFERDQDVVSQDELELQRDLGFEDEQDDDFEDDDDRADEQGEVVVEEVTETAEKGIPLPVSSTVLIAAVAVGIVALWLFTRDGSNSEPEQEQQNQQEGDVFGGSGLLGEV